MLLEELFARTSVERPAVRLVHPVQRKRLQLFTAKIKIDLATNCWLWTAHINKVTGYGQFWDGERVIGAHVYSYVTFNGPLPRGTEPDHLCRIRCCASPDHLEAVTHRINLLRGDTIAAQKAAQTHCVYGHELSGENLYLAKNGTRQCRICRAEKYRQWVADNRERRREIDREAYRKRVAKETDSAEGN